MNLYKFKQQFDPNTGKPSSSKRISGGHLDDYTGNLINSDELLMYTVSIAYNHGAEPLWYYDKELSDLEKKYGVEYSEFSSFMNSPYTFAELSNSHGSVDRSFQLIQEWLMNTKNGLGPFRECGTIEDAFRVARYRTLMRILKENTYTLVQLGLTLSKPSDL